MPDEQHPVDDLLKRIVGSPTSSQDEKTAAEAALQQAIENDVVKPLPGRRSRQLVWTAAAVALIIGLVVVFRPWAVSPAAAAMEEVAALTETLDPVEATDDTFVYTRSETSAITRIPREGLGDIPYGKDQLLYYTNTIRETWFGNDNTVQIAITLLEPTFLNSEDEAVYYEAGLDEQDQIGETITTTVTDPTKQVWPTDRDKLDAAIREAMVTDRGLPETVEYLDVALDIVRESFSSPQLRAATLRLIGDLNGLQLVETSATGSVTFLIEYTDRNVDTRLTFIIDGNGYLRYEQLLNLTADQEFGIPANTSVFVAEYSEPLIVDGLDAP